jgi:hypothetical protein
MRSKVDPKVALTNLRASIIHDAGVRVGVLLDRYDAMFVLPIRMGLEWHLLPLWRRAWLRLTGRKPDIAAAQEARMQELLDKVHEGCPATKNGMGCQLDAGHPGPHMRASKVSGTGVMEWEDGHA